MEDFQKQLNNLNRIFALNNQMLDEIVSQMEEAQEKVNAFVGYTDEQEKDALEEVDDIEEATVGLDRKGDY